MADSARIEELKRRVLVDPASIAFAALAEEYRRAGQYEDAIATCRTGLQRHPAYLSARVTLGRALLELGRYDEARTELELVLRTAPENLAAIRGLAEIHHRSGDLPETEAPPDPPPVAPAPVAPPAAAPVSVAPASVVPPPTGPVPVAPALPVAPTTAPVPVAPASAVAPPTAPVPVAPAPAVAPPPAPAKAAPVPSSTPAPVVAAPSPAPLPVSVSAPPAPRPNVTEARPEPGRSAAPAVAPPRRPHPDEAALPALEAFLSAIVGVRSSAR